MNVSESERRLGIFKRFGYAVGSLGAGLYSTVPGILLLYFMTQQLGLAVHVASLVVLAPKLAVVILDPLIGAWSDGLRSKWGRRRPFMLAGSLTSGVFFVAMFSTPSSWPEPTAALAVGVSYFLASLTYSVFAVPYVALPAELRVPRKTQADLIGLRMVFVFAGVLVGAAAAPVLVEAFGGGRVGYSGMALTLAAISTATMLFTTFAAPTSHHDPASSQPVDLARLVGFFKYLPFLAGVLVYALAITAIGTASAAAPYFVSFTLLRPESDIAVIFLSQILTSLVLMMAWARLVSRLGAADALTASAIIGAAGFLALAKLGPGSTTLALAGLAALTGIGVGGIQVSAFALLAKLTEDLNAASHGRHEGVLTGIWTATEKLALAFGPAICGLILALGDFKSGAPADLLPQSALSATRWAMTGAPTTILVLGVVLAVNFRDRLTASEPNRLHKD